MMSRVAQIVERVMQLRRGGETDRKGYGTEKQGRRERAQNL